MFEESSIMDKLENPVMFVDENGNIRHINENARHLLKILKLKDTTQIRDIDKDFDKNLYLEKMHLTQNIGTNIEINADVFSLKKHGEIFFLYLFEYKVFLSKKSRKIVDCVDDGIVIVNGKGQLELANIAVLRSYERPDFIESYCVDDDVGRELQSVLNDIGLDYEALTPAVLKSKKIMSKNMKYKSSFAKDVIRTVTGVPLLDDEGEIEQIIFTTRDISGLVEMEIKLSEIEKFKKEYFNQIEELNKYRSQNKLIYSSSVIEKLLCVAYKVAGTDSSVFITGESGVGKEEFAKYIHANSNRKDMPFVAINCAAIPSELIESELFGYDKGAFTGAKNTGKKGLFEEGNGGTIFLDEIGEMPWALQTKLLRVIQEGCFTRVGGTVPIKLNARYISATNLINEKLKVEFRQDLYYRLNTITINIPPLRERKDDIIPLSFHFLEIFNEKYKRNIKFSKNVIRALINQKWMGNVRELKSAIERLVILTDNDMVEIDEFEDIMELNKTGLTDEDVQIKEIMPLSEAYQKVEQILIENTYKKYGTIAETARVLGITPSTIYRKIKEGTLVLKKTD